MIQRTEQLGRADLGQFDPGFLPALSYTLVNASTGLGEAESLIELQDVIPQGIAHVIEVVVGQLVEQLAIGRVGQRVLS